MGSFGKARSRLVLTEQIGYGGVDPADAGEKVGSLIRAHLEGTAGAIGQVS